MIRTISRIVVVVLFVSFSISTIQAQKTLDRISKSGELKVGMTANQPPYSMKAKDGSISGYEVDLATMFAESMGVKLNVQDIVLRHCVQKIIWTLLSQDLLRGISDQ